ncbi:MAG TPA: GtrA family protein [Ktedonobacterales bacterium]|nr:GtrA family protein [Ktedonobacterales bacterium]
MADRFSRDDSRDAEYPAEYSDGRWGRQPQAVPRASQWAPPAMPNRPPQRDVDGYGGYSEYDGYGPYGASRRPLSRPNIPNSPPVYNTMVTTNPPEDSIDMLETQKYAAPKKRTISYQPTRWAVVNSLLDWADDLTGGKAGVLQRLFTYLLIGGTAALVNLAVIALLGHFGSINVKNLPYYLFANVVAYEISIMANFVPNDYITFRHLPGHSRSWAARCLRFHITSIGGIIVTFVIASTLNGLVGLPFLIAQAIALIIAVFFNFTFHHLFTYRGQKH